MLQTAADTLRNCSQVLVDQSDHTVKFRATRGAQTGSVVFRVLNLRSAVAFTLNRGALCGPLFAFYLFLSKLASLSITPCRRAAHSFAQATSALPLSLLAAASCTSGNPTSQREGISRSHETQARSA